MGIKTTLRKLGSGTYYLSLPKGWIEAKEWEEGETEFEIKEISKNEFKLTKKS